MSEAREMTLEELPSIAEYKRVEKQREALKKALIRLMQVGRLATEDDYEFARRALDLAAEGE